jgi:hypothetical protein
MGDYYDGQMLYTSSAEPANLLLVAAASNMYYQPYWRYGMTVAIRTELYKKGIFGYSWAYQTSGGYDYLIHRPLWTYYFQQDGLNANYGVMISSIPLLTTEEVLLNRAEANALLGNYEDALIDMIVLQCAILILEVFEQTGKAQVLSQELSNLINTYRI